MQEAPSDFRIAPRETIQGYKTSDYDFIAFGKAITESISYGMRRFGGQSGLGVSPKGATIQQEREQGFAVIDGASGILDLLLPTFRYCLLINSVQFQPSRKEVKNLIRSASNLSQDFLYIRYPYFDANAYLKELGLRLSWAGLKSHKTMTTLDEMRVIFEELGLHQYFIRRLKPIVDSSHPCVLPFDAPQDQGQYQPSQGPKPLVQFEQSIWHETEIFIPRRPMEAEAWAAIVNARVVQSV